jgi:myo-inositol 2-dehydrogenase / D-chiro-inositol 1-dehydrogenase
MLRIAVLGAGRIGRIHAGNVVAHPRARLVAVADPYGTAAADLAGQLGCEASLDPLATIARDDVDAVVIGTPTDTHVSLMLHAVERGKAVLCEKPIDLDIGKVDAAVAAIDQKGGRVMVAFNRRFDPSAQALRRAIDAGAVGDVRQVIITSRDPGLASRDYLIHSGGIFRDMVIHDFDMARFLLGEEPVEVTASASRLVDPGLAEFNDFDTVMVLMRTASGRQCHVNCCREAVYGYDQRLEVLGSRGMVLNDNLRPTTLRRWSADETEVREPLLNFFLERYAESYRIELGLFIDSVSAGGAMPVTPQDGRQALRLADCALESALSGRTVTV